MSFNWVNINVISLKLRSLSVSVGLLLFDLTGVFLSFYLAAKARYMMIPWIGGQVYWPVYVPVVYLAMGFTVVALIAANLYPGYGLTAVVEIERTVKPITFVYALLATTVYVFDVYEYFPRSIFFMAWGLSLLFVPLVRFFLRNRLSLLPWYGLPVLFVAPNGTPPRGLEALQNCRRMGWKPLAVYVLGDSHEKDTGVDVPLLTSWEQMLAMKENEAVDTVLVSISDIEQHRDFLQMLSKKFKHLVLVFPADYLGSIWVYPRDLEGRLGLELRFQLLEPTAVLIKKCIDIILGAILLVLILPFVLVIAIMIRLDSPGPVLFRQERLGKGFARFKVLKFRTMAVDAEQKLQYMLEEDPQSWREYRLYHKLANDPRVTRMGRWLRKFSVDELPQLWNVVRGEMSLIGPRAYLPSELDDMGRYADLILQVKPGLTGWWQVMGRQETPFQRRLKLDQYYISNWSLWLDLYVFLKTFWVILRGQGT